MSPKEIALIEAGHRYRDVHREWKLRDAAWKAEFPDEYEAWYGGVARGEKAVLLFDLPNWQRMVRAANDAEMEASGALREAAMGLPTP